MDHIVTDVIIIGGGATGACVTRDLAHRGIRTVLIEKEDLAAGTTGRNHGLLHSGARYAVNDMESATECISENKILRTIAGHCIEETGGLFVTLPEDDPSYHHKLIQACEFAGIRATEISIRKALEIEPNLNPAALLAIRVPDGTIDPFRYTASTVLDAREHGAQVMTHTAVTEIISSNGQVTGVRYLSKNGREGEIHAPVIVNASGAWAQAIAALAGIELRIFPAKGSMVILDYRVNKIVVNRCRPPSDGDIIVPGDTVSLLGTTSSKIDYSEIDDLRVHEEEIDILLSDGEKLIPEVRNTRVLRAYCGVRPLLDAGGDAGGRQISRGIALVNHGERDGLAGFITIAGGKLMTSRLMGEKTADLVCRILGVSKSCSTHRIPLPGSEWTWSLRPGNLIRQFAGIPASIAGSTIYRHGRRVFSFLNREPDRSRLICECEMVTEGEVEYAITRLQAETLVDLRRRTRIGMGPCQGELCSYRAAGLMEEYSGASPLKSVAMLREFLEERWKGVRPVLWGDGLRELEFTYWIYQGLLGLEREAQLQARTDEKKTRGADDDPVEK